MKMTAYHISTNDKAILTIKEDEILEFIKEHLKENQQVTFTVKTYETSKAGFIADLKTLLNLRGFRVYPV